MDVNHVRPTAVDMNSINNAITQGDFIMRKKLAVVAVPFVLPFLFATQSAVAAGYLEVGAGTANASIAGTRDSTPIRVDGGFMISNSYGIEVGYLDSGKFNVRNSASGAYYKVTGPYVALSGFNMISDRVELTGKLGAMQFDEKANGAVSANTKSGTSPVLGIGVNYYFNPAIAVGAEYTYLDDIHGDHVSSGWVMLHIKPGAGYNW